MAARACRYYGNTFQGYRSVTQGDPLSPLILNYMVDTIFRHWVGLVADNKAVPDGFGYTVTEKAFF